MKIGFDNEKYLKMQSEHIRERIGQFDNKLYLEFGGKLFDDYHASRVLPGFQPDSKLCMLRELSDQAEIVIVIHHSCVIFLCNPAVLVLFCNNHDFVTLDLYFSDLSVIYHFQKFIIGNLFCRGHSLKLEQCDHQDRCNNCDQ